MKASEFYENYWLINGKRPPPLSEKEKEWLDEVSKYNHTTAMFFRKRKRPVSINIDYLKEDMRKLPQYFTPANQPKLDKYGQAMPSEPEVQVCDATKPPKELNDDNQNNP